MTCSQYCFSWDSYKRNVCNGFSQLQQSEEFVDMTLVAGEHLVKVHKNLMALASPVLKQIILMSSPTQYPIIFLNDISHEVLCYIIEYVYTGEARVPIDKLQVFLKAAENLHLCGIDNLISKDQETEPQKQPPVANLNQPTITIEPLVQNLNNGFNSEPIPVDNYCENISLENINIQPMNVDTELPNQNSLPQINMDFPIQLDTNSLIAEDNLTKQATLNQNLSYNLEARTPKNDSSGGHTQQYSISTRGCLQMVLDKHIYYLHHHAKGGRRRRWRCLDYRWHRCPAYVDTLNDVVTARKNAHEHRHHGDKIHKKAKANLIFGSLRGAAASAQRLVQGRIMSLFPALELGQ